MPLGFVEIGHVLEDFGAGANGGDAGEYLVQQLAEQRIRAQPVGIGIGIGDRIGIGAMQARQGGGASRILGNQVPPLIGPKGQRLDNGVGKGFFEVLQQLLLGAASQFVDIDVQLGGHAVEQGAANVAFIVLDKVEVAGRNTHQPCQSSLGNPQ